MPAKKKVLPKRKHLASSDRKQGSMFGSPLVKLREERHVLDRPSFWAGLLLLALSMLLFIQGTSMLTTLTTAFGGALALFIE
ncbi:Uncharacterised protein [uncultured archaeon]|nr:Uncharacterised protein [uncultured archaeon]